MKHSYLSAVLYALLAAWSCTARLQEPMNTPHKVSTAPQGTMVASESQDSLIALKDSLSEGSSGLLEDLLQQTIPRSEDYLSGTLDNGLTYYIKKNNKPADKVELRLIIKAGSILEDDEQQGMAHFLEHMLFNGTKNFEKNTLIDYLQKHGVKFGAHINAYTSFDETVYMLSLPTDDTHLVDTGYQILEDWAHAAVLSDEEIEKERGVVLEEYRIGLGAEKRMMKDYLPKLFFESRYAKRLPIGQKEIIESGTAEKLRQFYADWYRPNLMAVVVAGDIDPEKAEAKIVHHFGSLKNPMPQKPRLAFELPNHRSNLVSISKDSEAPYGLVRFYIKSPKNKIAMRSGADYRKSTIRRLANNMLNQRLSEIQKAANPPFVYAAVGYGNTVVDTKESYQGFVVVGENQHLNALRIVLQELERAKQHGFLEAEVLRAKESMLRSYERSYKEQDKTETNRYVEEITRNFLENEPIPGIAWEYEFIQKVLPKISSQEILLAFREIYADQNTVFILTGPDKSEIIMPTEEEVLATWEEVRSTTHAPYEEGYQIQGSLMKTPSAPTANMRTILQDTLLGTTDIELPNGVRITYLNTTFQNDEILFHAYSTGGEAYMSDDDFEKVKYGLDGVPSAGIGGHTQVELEKFLKTKQLSLRTSISEYQENMSGKSTPRDLELLLQHIHLSFTSLNIDTTAFKSYLQRQKQLYTNLNANPKSFFYNKVYEDVYRENKRYVSFPTEEDWKSIDYHKAHELYSERFENPADFRFYFVGNIEDTAHFHRLCNTYLGTLPTKEDQEEHKNLGIKTHTNAKETIIRRGKDNKSLSLMIYQHPAVFSAEENVMLNALAEAMQIRLTEKLREELSGIYGISVRASMEMPPANEYRFSITYPCSPEKIELLHDTTASIIDNIVNLGPTQEEVDKVLQSNLKDHLTNIEENHYWLNSIITSDMLGASRHSVLSQPQRLKTLITKENLHLMAKKYLSQERATYFLFPEE